LIGANFSEANLNESDFSNANLSGANLSRALLVGANFQDADISSATVFGVSAWDLTLDGADQSRLVLLDGLTVDNIEVAQFIYLLLNNSTIRQTIEAITTRVVLILGRFSPERKPVLDVLRNRLRNHGFVPVIFDFPKPDSRDFTETISTLAHLARFVVADITDARSVPQELQTIVPHLPSVPVQPIIHSSAIPYGMFEHFSRYPWVLDLHSYSNVDDAWAVIEQETIPYATKTKSS
jgi:hypothetical protein